MTLDCKISKQRKKETEDISPQTAMVWFEFISSQVSYFVIFSYFCKYMLPRRNKDGRRQLVLKGKPDVSNPTPIWGRAAQGAFELFMPTNYEVSDPCVFGYIF